MGLQLRQPLPNPVAMQMTEQQPASAPSDWIQPEHSQMLEVLSRGPRMLQDRDRELVLEGVRNGCFPRRWREEAQIRVGAFAVSWHAFPFFEKQRCLLGLELRAPIRSE